MAMNVNNLNGNKTEVELNGKTLFFSYRTLVAANIDGKFYRTSQKYSVTTSKHITQWLDGRNAVSVDQAELERLAQ